MWMVPVLLAAVRDEVGIRFLSALVLLRLLGFFFTGRRKLVEPPEKRQASGVTP